MANIHILNKFISNKISAGEVVEKPASVVKELIENSIDANANSILIEIENGGIQKIMVVDDGCGIQGQDVKLAFLPHATSKITEAVDLENISTLGFRGEALSSISAVSQVELTTKTKEENIATYIKLEGGEIIKFNQIAGNQGTKIIVSSLFYNTPARKKFLRKSKTEEGEITHLIEKFILANPTKKIKYIIDGRLIYNTMGSSTYDNIYTIYGKEIANNVIKIEYENNKYKLQGYIGNTQIAKPNRTYQTLFVNKRIVTNYMISSAIQSAYENFLMKKRFPFFVLNFIVPYNSVDVNIHPSKQEVKFENPNEIYSFFAKAINDALYSVKHIKNLEEEVTTKIELPELKKDYGVSYQESFNNMEKSSYDTDAKNKNNIQFATTESKLDEIFLDNYKTNNQQNNLSKCEKVEDFNVNNGKIIGTINQQNNLSKCEKVEDFNVNNGKIIGTIFETYILVELDNKLYLIDQHACHERKLYNDLIKFCNTKDILKQDLLLPFTFSCNSLEFAFYLENLENFNKLGFEIEEFGNNNLKISTIPFLLQNINLREFVDDISKDLITFSKNKGNILKDFLAKKACKSAVKAGDFLSREEINVLLNDMQKLPTLLCPHGRPIVIEITKREIEKWFKRII